MPWSPPWERSDRDAYRLTFDEDEEAYDRTRPVAPERVFDDILGLAGLQAGSSIGEIGRARARPHAHSPSAASGSSHWSVVPTWLHELDTTWRRSPTSRY
jgi:hypothetical protein